MKKWALLLLFLIPLLVAGCASQAQRVWLKSPGWSRARLIAFTRVGDPISGTVDGRGRVHLFFAHSEEDGIFLRLVSLDPVGQISRDRIFREVTLERPSLLKAAWDGRQLHLFWIERSQVFHAPINGDAQAITPVQLSGSAVAARYDLAIAPGGALTLWYGGSPGKPGIYATRPSEGSAPVLVDPLGVDPDIQYDAQGDLHTVWAHKPPGGGDKPFFYASYPGGIFLPGREAVAYVLRVAGTSSLEGPRLGLDPDRAYVIWSQQFFSGLDAGTARTQFLSFPKGRTPPRPDPVLLTIPGTYDLPYEPQSETPFLAGDRVVLAEDFFGTGQYILQLETNATSDREFVTVFHTRTAYLMRKVQAQIGAVYFQDGVPSGYQLLSFTPASSSKPEIFSDREGHLYLTWLEKGAEPGWAIYFASTAPSFAEGLRGLTGDDLGRMFAETIFGLASGAILVPLALVWIIPALLTLALTGRLRSRETLKSPAAILTLGLSLMVLWVIKLGFLPGISEYVPFSAWMPVAGWLEAQLQYGVPLGMAVLAIAAAGWVERRRESGSVYTFLLLYSAIDGVLTMAVYGVLIYAAF